MFEEWYRFDDQEKLVDYDNWLISSDGTVEQECFLKNGKILNVTSGSSSELQNGGDVDFTVNFIGHLKSEKIFSKTASPFKVQTRGSSHMRPMTEPTNLLKQVILIVPQA